MTDPVTLAVDLQGVATVSLNRPEVHNALDGDTIGFLLATVETLAEDDSIRAVVLTGRGINFSIGHDIEWTRRLTQAGAEEIRYQAGQMVRLLTALDNLDKPLIARVQGSAFGPGAALIACADVAIGVSEALFGFSEVKLGVVPSVIAPWIIRAIGERATRRYFMTAERFNAGKAKRLGLLHQVLEADELDTAVTHAISQLLVNSPAAMAEAKRLVNRIGKLGASEEAIAAGIESTVRVRTSAEGREGIQAFLDKRKPDWMK
ncbi:enoyl-CoA hydratase-related protein [Paludibacterium paludis]|uniref:Enoyl-CoA hydratase n=1 Tax=Paludibacterium paludis TaxID=1225769 RepID=A0A918NYI1_9NEIS|nr:enoyl-CoA hydratase-related protein [Paludibacterium paludis]GGY06600.1 enoyl-CoA hydratase [Paludibacterium paludis]